MILRRAALVALTAGTAFAVPAHADGKAGSFDRYSFTNDQGTRTYKVFVPPSWKGQSLPLVVELHGCGGDADADAKMSLLNQMATKRNVLVAYPEESAEANGTKCWNWFSPDHQTRGKGEPSIIAGITAAVQKRWHGDVRRTYIAGFSAGAGMAVDMVATYPDVYAAGLSLAGCEYKGTTCFGGPGALPPSVAGDLAFDAMGSHARVVPMLVVDGDGDFTVPAMDGTQLTQSMLQTDDRVEAAAGRKTPMSRQPARTRTDRTASGVTSDVRTFTDLRGCQVVDQWVIHGMGHQWPQDPADANGIAYLNGPFNGPDLAGIAMTFFLHHPMPTTRGCSFKA